MKFLKFFRPFNLHCASVLLCLCKLTLPYVSFCRFFYLPLFPFLPSVYVPCQNVTFRHLVPILIFSTLVFCRCLFCSLACSPLSANIHYLSHIITVILNSKLLPLLLLLFSQVESCSGDKQIKRQCDNARECFNWNHLVHRKICLVSVSHRSWDRWQLKPIINCSLSLSLSFFLYTHRNTRQIYLNVVKSSKMFDCFCQIYLIFIARKQRI